jgi:hypothetical protein
MIDKIIKQLQWFKDWEEEIDYLQELKDKIENGDLK